MESATLIGGSTPGLEPTYYGPHVQLFARKAVGCGPRRCGVCELHAPRAGRQTHEGAMHDARRVHRSWADGPAQRPVRRTPMQDGEHQGSQLEPEKASAKVG
eukprot:2645893-Prymnesium_polylepis.1